MIISKVKSQTDTVERAFQHFLLGLLEGEFLTEAIKKDDVNAAEHSTLHILDESDLDRAERLLKMAKRRRENTDALALLKKNTELAASEITAYIQYRGKKRMIYTLKRQGFKNRRYEFQVTGSGKLSVFSI